MRKPALVFSEIEVRRLPGFPRGGPHLQGLGPGLHLVFGRNGAGKSTTVRAAKALLWPERLRRDLAAEIAGRFAIAGLAGESAYRLEIASGQARYELDGAPAPPPALPPADFHDRYDLALETLLRLDGEPLVREIQREVAGGYDLTDAVAKAGFRERGQRSGRPTSQLAEAEQRVAKLTRAQEELRRQEETLRDLRAHHDEAREARRRTEALGRALALARAERRRRELLARLASFPAVLARLHGNEATRLAELTLDLAEAARRTAEATATVERLESQLADLGPTPEALSREAVAALAARLDQLREVERERLQAEREEAELAARARQALAAFGAGEAPDLERFHADPSATPHRLATLLGEAETLRADEALAARAREALGGLEAGEDPAALAQLAALLQRWQASAGSLLVAAVGLGLALVLGGAGFRLHRAEDGLWWLPAAGAVLAFGLAGWQALLARDRARLRGDLDRLAAGTGRPVADLDDLAGRLRAALDRQARQQIWHRLGLDPARLDEARQALARRCAEAAGPLGLRPDLDVLRLSFLGGRLQEAAAAHDHLLAARARLGPLRSQRQELHDHLAAGIAAGGLAVPATADVATLAAQVAELDRRQRTQAQLGEQLAAERRAREAARAQIATGEAKVAAFWRELDPPPQDGTPGDREPGDGEQLAAWQAELPAYRAAEKALGAAEQEIAALRAGLAGETALGDLDEPELERRRDRERELAEQEDDWKKKIDDIEADIRHARRGHDLEAALAARDAARDALRQERDRDLVQVAGWLLAERLREEVAERSQPAVLQKAEELFALITRDRYRLRTQSGPSPSLRVIERTSRQGLDLDQLSTGTRIQLLLAIRLAFVELHEPGVALPLFLDEVLATSDDQRATAVIEAIAAVARAGRQVFVLTAQESELALWRSVTGELERQGLGVPFRELDLHAPDTRLRPAPPAAAPRPLAPAPDGRDHAGYGELLAVPAFAPLVEDVGALHLWYLIEDPPLLHRLLAAGYERWAPTAALLGRGLAEALVPGGAPALARAEALARALAAAHAAWRVGRGRPVDRAVLAASGAVSEVFLDRVAEIATEAGGNAAVLVTRLESGAAKRFQATKIEDVTAYLENTGYLDPRPAKSAEDLRLAALAAVREELEAGALRLDEIERLLARAGILTTGSAATVVLAGYNRIRQVISPASSSSSYATSQARASSASPSNQARAEPRRKL